MTIAKVIGNVVSTKKVDFLVSYKLLIVQPLEIKSETELLPSGKPIIAVDTVDAGYGETVLLVSGSSARMAVPKDGIPIDLAIIGIIDSVQVDEPRG